jgi:hypothetical protein
MFFKKANKTAATVYCSGTAFTKNKPTINYAGIDKNGKRTITGYLPGAGNVVKGDIIPAPPQKRPCHGN